MARGLTVHGSEFATLEYSSDGSAWVEVPGISGYGESGGEAPERDIVAFSGVAKRSGHPRVPSIELSAAYTPAHAAWKALRGASLDGTLLRFRLTTKKNILEPITGTGNTVAIADTGIVTFAGTVKPNFNEGVIGPGLVIEAGSENYVIDSVSDADTPVVTVKPAPASDVTAKEDYNIVLPSLRRGPFSATVRIVGNVSLESEGDMTTTLTLAPRGQLPEWSIV